VAELTNNVRASNERARYQQKAHVAERGKLNQQKTKSGRIFQ